jgi:hypothetical protein
MGFAPQYQNSQSLENGVAHFQPFQIVCLAYTTTRLYAEVVQIVEARDLCWARPLALLDDLSTEDPSLHPEGSPRLYDLRQGSDLLLPKVLFRQAVDTEVMPVLSQLYKLEKAEDTITTRQLLNQFIHQVWQAHPDVFSRK